MTTPSPLIEALKPFSEFYQSLLEWRHSQFGLTQAKWPEHEPVMRRSHPLDDHYARDCFLMVSDFKRASEALRIATETTEPDADNRGLEKLINAAREFVRKVEAGEARSKQSYGEFKAALHEIDNAAPQSPKAIRAEALEQAAKIADDFDWYSMGGPQDIGPNAIEKVSDEIATAIRSLGDRG